MAAPIPLHEIPVLRRTDQALPRPEQFASGLVIPVDKPKGWSSFDVVRFVRARIPIRKVGHAGTLDPMATGLLLLCCGKATRSVSQIQTLLKSYHATIMFGATTPSYDAESEIVERAPWKTITHDQILQSINENFTGQIDQVPPIYSALHVKGERMYKLARRGEEIRPEPRRVEVHKIELIGLDLPEARISVRCGKGFYVRSLAHDLGRSLNSLAYLRELRRTATGSFLVEDAWTIDEIKQWERHGNNDKTG